MSDEIPERTEKDLESARPFKTHRRLMRGQIESGDDIVALRLPLRLTREQLAQASGIEVHTLGNWEQGLRRPEGPAAALLRVAAHHPCFIREILHTAATVAVRGAAA